MVGKHIYSHLPLQTGKHIYGHLPLQSTQSSYIDYSPIGYIHQFFGRASIFFVFAMLISLKIEHYIYIYIIHEQKIKVRLMGNWFTIFFSFLHVIRVSVFLAFCGLCYLLIQMRKISSIHQKNFIFENFSGKRAAVRKTLQEELLSEPELSRLGR